MRNAYEDRVVEFEQVHSIRDSDMEALLQIIDPKPGQSILDGAAGYGAVTKMLMEQTSGWNPVVNLHAMELSRVQLARLRQNLSGLPESNIIQGDMRDFGADEAQYDTYIIKTGIQELPSNGQLLAFKEAWRVLKPGGRFIVWQPVMMDTEIQAFFSDVIREKDRLAGFISMVLHRYFGTADEFRTLFETAGFVRVERAHDIPYRLKASNRRYELASTERQRAMRSKGTITEEEVAQLEVLGQARVKALMEYIRWRVTEPLKTKVDYLDRGDDIEFTVTKQILVGHKPI